MSIVFDTVDFDAHTFIIDSNDGVLLSQVPFFSANLINPSPYEWNYTTTVQSGLGGRSIPYPRGHILGGSSSTSTIRSDIKLTQF